MALEKINRAEQECDMRSIALLLLVACAHGMNPDVVADTRMLGGHRFTGPRVIAIAGGSDQDVSRMEEWLRHRGFRVVRQIPGLANTKPIAAYLMNVDGVCGGGFSAATMRADVYDTATSERVFAAAIFDPDGCPEAFFRDASAGLVAQWPP